MLRVLIKNDLIKSIKMGLSVGWPVHSFCSSGRNLGLLGRPDDRYFERWGWHCTDRLKGSHFRNCPIVMSSRAPAGVLLHYILTILLSTRGIFITFFKIFSKIVCNLYIGPTCKHYYHMVIMLKVIFKQNESV